MFRANLVLKLINLVLKPINQFGFEANQLIWFRSQSVYLVLPDGVGQPDVGRRGIGGGEGEARGRKWSREILVWDVMELSLLKRRSQSDGTTLQNYHKIWFTDGCWTSPKRLPRGRGLWVVRRSGGDDGWPL